MKKGKIGIGVIGCGSISGAHLSYLTSREDIELIGVCDIIEEKAKQRWAEFGALWYTTNYKELLQDDRIDAVFVLVPQGLHAEIVVAAAQHGKHIFCEKPMAMTVAECQAMRKAVEHAGVIFQIGYVLRFSTDILKVKQWLELIGRPALFRDMWNPSPWASPHPWVFDKKMGGGPIYEASHWIDFMNFLFGRPKRVYASFHHFKPGGLTAPDTFLLVIDYEDGDRAVWSDAECLPGFGEFRIRHVGTRPALSIIGPKGSIHFPATDGSKMLSLYLNHFGDEPVETHPWETDWGATGKAYQAEVDYFLECVRNERCPEINTAEDGEWVIQVIEGAFLSHEKGRPVELPLQRYPVNSREWWENYFENYWEVNKGSEQTRHYMELILANLPILEMAYMRSTSLRILDWGCAFGDGAALLAQFFPLSRAFGLDFAQKAIEEARRRYPHLEFILTQQGEIPGEFDVIVTSHTLEHLENPLEKVKRHLLACKDLYIILVPYDEHPLPEYHRSQFREESFPERLGNFLRIHVQVIPDMKYGKQLLVVYGSEAYLQKRAAMDLGRLTERLKWERYYASLPLLEEDEAMKRFGEEFAKVVEELLPPGSCILEAGCGAGWQSLALARLKKYKISLMDFSEEALKYAKKMFERENLEAEFILGDVFETGEPKYDLVFNAGVLEHYTFDKQVAFLKGMASRSRKYLMILVPNRLCYWYWLWRVQKSGEGEWPFGKEVPLTDLSEVFKAAGLQFLGQRFMGESWTEEFVSNLIGLDKKLRQQIVEIHRSPLIPKSQKSYLLAALGSVAMEALRIPPGWSKDVFSTEKGSTDEIYAALADALALRINAESKLVQLGTQLAEKERELTEREQVVQTLTSQLAEKERELTEREQVVQTLTSQLAEKEQLLHKIYTSRGFRLVAWIWELRASWKAGIFPFAKFLIKPIFRKLPPKIQTHLLKAYMRLQNLSRQVPIQTYKDETYDLNNYGVGESGLVSVILPVYNQASLLRESIQSVLQQTYKQFELIIVDDGSTDEVEDVLEEFSQHPQVFILRHPRNQGLPKALNTGFDFARGEFWTWTSADNVMLPQQLERLVEFLQTHPDVAMVYSDYLAIDDRGNPLQDPRFRPHNRETPNSPIIRLPRSTEKLNIVKDNFIGPSFLYRGWVGRLLGDYDPLFMGAEDYDYWMRINNLFKIAHLGTDEILYKYRVHDNTLNARAAELGIFERVDRLMEYEKTRREFFQQPFTFYLDSETYEWLSNELQNGGFMNHVYLLSQWQPSIVEHDKKILIIASTISPEWLKTFEPQKNTFVILRMTPGSTLVYELGTTLMKKIDFCFAMDKESYQRSALFTKKVLLVNKPKDFLRLAMAAANNAIYYRLTHDEASTRGIKPIIYFPKERKITILLQTDTFDKGGLERVVYNCARYLDRSRFYPVILVVSRNGMFGQRALKAGITIIELPSTEREKTYREILKQYSVDIVNAHYSTFGLEIAAEQGIPVVQTIHNCYVWFTPDTIENWRKLEKFTKHYIAVSSNVAKYSDVKLGLDPKRMTIISNGIDINEFAGKYDGNIRKNARFSIRSRYGVSNDDFLFLCTSAFFAHKGQLQIVEALSSLLASFQKIKVMFLGEAVDLSYYEKVRKRVKDLGLENQVIFAGFQDDPSDFYLAADAFLLPSLWEGWSLALGEALYFGLPIVATDVGAARELIDETGLGILVSPPFSDITEIDCTNLPLYLSGTKGNYEVFLRSLLEGMKHCLEANYTERDREKAHQVIAERYNAERMALEYSQLFLEIVRRQNKSAILW